jgi:hypothetical protein
MSKMPKSTVNAQERDKKIQWLRKHRESVAYCSVVPRPQRVRMLWANSLKKEKT